MTQPDLAHATDFGRMYSRQRGGHPEVPSITTVIGMQSARLDGWIGYMAANAVANHPGLRDAVTTPAHMRPLVRECSDAAESYRNAAAARGDRVHYYAEQVSLREMGMEHRAAAALTELEQNGELSFAKHFDTWWQQFGVKPLAPEVTVWNKTLGYAGTMDLVAEIGGRTCLIDFKTRGTTRDGGVKPLDPKVAMQLVAGMKAEEQLQDPDAGTWGEWAHGDGPLLLGVGIGETGVLPVRVNPDVMATHWYKFVALHRLWQRDMEAARAGRTLLPVPPPAPQRTSTQPSNNQPGGEPSPGARPAELQPGSDPSLDGRPAASAPSEQTNSAPSGSESTDAAPTESAPGASRR